MHLMIVRSLPEYRSLHRLTLEALGAMFDVNKTTVLRWEAGRIPAERVVEISRVTGITRSDLRPDLFGIDFIPGHSATDPAKAPAAPSASVSQSDAEPLACAGNHFLKSRKVVARAE